MADLNQIFIPQDASQAGGSPTTSKEDEPPRKERITPTDDEKAETVATLKSNRELREIFAGKAYKVAKYGLYWWATVLLLSAVGKMCGKEIFSDQVLIAVTTASTLNLFAAFLGVIRGLFPSGKNGNSEL